MKTAKNQKKYERECYYYIYVALAKCKCLVKRGADKKRERKRDRNKESTSAMLARTVYRSGMRPLGLGPSVGLRFAQLRLQSSTSSSSTISHISNLQEFETAMKQQNISVVDFFATWCGPCKMVAPHLQKLSEKYPDVKFYKVDVDESPDIAGALGVSAMPTFMLFREGKGLGKIVGADPRGVEEAVKHFRKLHGSSSSSS